MSSSLTKFLECPVCFEIPRNRSVFICVNGHSICSTCKDGVGDECPIARCQYPFPLVRNRAIEDMLQSSDIVLPCLYTSSGCDFVAPRVHVETHENVCAHRTVYCPRCCNSAALSKMIEHFREHEDAVFERLETAADGSMNMTIYVGYPDVEAHSRSEISLLDTPMHVFQGERETVVVYPFLVDSMFSLYVGLLADLVEADEYACDISLSNETNSIRIKCEVCSIDDDGIAKFELHETTLKNFKVKLLNEETIVASIILYRK